MPGVRQNQYMGLTNDIEKIRKRKMIFLPVQIFRWMAVSRGWGADYKGRNGMECPELIR